MGTEAPVGEWETPITSKLIVSGTVKLMSPKVAPDGWIYFLEGRPSEGGRQVLVRSKLGGKLEDVTPGPDGGLYVRTTVHEYGGGEWILGSSVIYFSNFRDQRLYVQQVGDAIQAPRPLTPENKGRYADGVVDARFKRIITVFEDHSMAGKEAVNSIAAVDLSSGAVSELVGGNDFYSAPRLSPDSARLAWVTWNHPNMPWDDTELWVADVEASGSLANHRKVAGGPGISVMEPRWGADGALLFISDEAGGWWNLHREAAPGSVDNLLPMQAELGGPAWTLGAASYQPLPDGRVLLHFSDPKAANERLALLDPATKLLNDVAAPYASFGSLSIATLSDGRLAVATVGGSPTRPSEVAMLVVAGADELLAAKPEQWDVLRKSSPLEMDAGFLSAPATVEFPTEGGRTAFMNYYPPCNKNFKLPPGHASPLLVKIHGGPTSQASTSFSLSIQYWTSRGFAIADVNYGGSTGYGREYRNRLRGEWGVVDVDDCTNAAKHLASQGRADAARLCISGGSAGGYTTLACLAFRKAFAAGASLYGVADCELLAQETHKFESRYLDLLIGPYPQDKDVYVKRSPINSLDKFDTPIAFFQGTEDEIVPPNQAEIMYEALKKKGTTTALVMFEGEQHGFRSANAIRRSLDGEFYFYGVALGFNATMPSDLEKIDIVNVKKQ